MAIRQLGVNGMSGAAERAMAHALADEFFWKRDRLCQRLLECGYICIPHDVYPEIAGAWVENGKWQLCEAWEYQPPAWIVENAIRWLESRYPIQRVHAQHAILNACLHCGAGKHWGASITVC